MHALSSSLLLFSLVTRQNGSHAPNRVARTRRVRLLNGHAILAGEADGDRPSSRDRAGWIKLFSMQCLQAC